MQSRDEIAEQVVALAGSVSNEKAAKMRALVELARMEGADGAKSREATIELVDSQVRARVDDLEREAGMNLHASKLLTDRIAALESSMSKVRERTYEIVREEIQRANSPAYPDRCASCGRAINGGEPHTTFCNGERALCSTCCPLPSPLSAAEVDEWKRAINEQHERKFGAHATTNTGASEEARGACGSGAFQPHLSRPEAAQAAQEKVSGTHTPDASAPSASVPEWLRSDQIAVNAIVTDFIRSVVYPLTLRETLVHGVVERLDCWWREINARVPRASTVSVEEMAERLRDAWASFHGVRKEGYANVNVEYWTALARSALSALPASEERPRLSDRYRLCSKCAAPDAEEIPASAHLPSCGWVQFSDGRVAETGECMCFGARVPSVDECMKHARETVERLGPNPNAHEVAREAARATRKFIVGKLPASEAPSDDILYRLARLVRNPDGIHATAWAMDAGDLLAELRDRDVALYESKVKAASEAPQPSPTWPPMNDDGTDPTVSSDDIAAALYEGDAVDLGLRDRAREWLHRQKWTDSRTLWAMEDFARSEAQRWRSTVEYWRAKCDTALRLSSSRTPRVDAEFVEVADCLRDRFDLLYRMNGAFNTRDAKETAHDEECLADYDRVREGVECVPATPERAKEGK